MLAREKSAFDLRNREPLFHGLAVYNGSDSNFESPKCFGRLKLPILTLQNSLED